MNPDTFSSSAVVRGWSCKKTKDAVKIWGEFPFSPKNCSRSQCRKDAIIGCKELKKLCKLLKGVPKKLCKAAAEAMCQANIAICSLCNQP